MDARISSEPSGHSRKVCGGEQTCCTERDCGGTPSSRAFGLRKNTAGMLVYSVVGPK